MTNCTITKTTSGSYSFTASYTINEEHNGIEISFSEKPGDIIRDELKKQGFRWHNVKKVWYAKNTADRLNLAERLATRNERIDEERKQCRKVAENRLEKIQKAEQAAPLVIPPSKFVYGGGLYDGWEGGNNKKWRSDKELKALLLADFKRAGISATIRFRNAGYLTSLTVTIKINQSDIVSYDTFKSKYSIPYSGWLSYEDDNGAHQDIFSDKFWSMEDRNDLAEKITKYAYKHQVARLTDSGSPHTRNELVLNEAANKKLSTVQAIVNSYNRDCSNSMVDYFDRDIYDHYTFKIA